VWWGLGGIRGIAESFKGWTCFYSFHPHCCSSSMCITKGIYNFFDWKCYFLRFGGYMPLYLIY
jgi:hypothetical protein